MTAKCWVSEAYGEMQDKFHALSLHGYIAGQATSSEVLLEVDKAD